MGLFYPPLLLFYSFCYYFFPLSLIVRHHTFLQSDLHSAKKITIFNLYLSSQPPPEKQETSWQHSSIFHRDHKSLSYPRHYPLRIFAPTSTHICLSEITLSIFMRYESLACISFKLFLFGIMVILPGFFFFFAPLRLFNRILLSILHGQVPQLITGQIKYIEASFGGGGEERE